MHSDFDPDDNFGQAFQPSTDIDEEDALEALVWQLLLLINPDDEDAALQQFAAFQDAMANAPDEEPTDLLRSAIDWRSAFFVNDDDTAALVDCVNELTARWNLRLDWGTDDDADDEFASTDVPALIDTAYDRLREYHYTLWTWDVGPDLHAGFITHRRDDEALRVLAGALGLPVRQGAG